MEAPQDSVSVDEWISKMWYIKILLSTKKAKKNTQVTSWMILEDIAQSEIYQLPKEKYCESSYMRCLEYSSS